MIVVAIIGILAAIAIPNFIKFQARSKQAEAKQALKGYFMAQRHIFSENDSYSSDFGMVGYQPERGNRYAYKALLAPTAWQSRASVNLTAMAVYQGIEVDCFRLGGTCVGQPARPSSVAAYSIVYESGVTGPADTGVVIGSSGGFTIEALGTIDNDDANDVWMVSSGTITVSPGACSEADKGVPGVMVSIYNDVSCP